MAEWHTPEGAAALHRFVTGELPPDPNAPDITLQRREYSVEARGRFSKFGGGCSCEWPLADPTAPIIFPPDAGPEFRAAAEVERRRFFKQSTK